MRTQTTLSAAGPLKQRGVTLIELMVGLSIGLLVVAVDPRRADGLASV